MKTISVMVYLLIAAAFINFIYWLVTWGRLQLSINRLQDSGNPAWSEITKQSDCLTWIIGSLMVLLVASIVESFNKEE